MRRKLTTLQPGHHRPLLVNGIDRLRIDRPLRHRPPTPDPPKHAALVDLGRRQPGIEGLNGPAGDIDNFVLLACCGFRAAEMDGKRGRGGPSATSIGGSMVSC